jgi:hypothetical protein
MKEIGVSVSKKQLSRLKNGHSVRVKEGEGLLIVNPDRYDLMSKTFAKGKSPTISLTPEEILLNTRGYQPEAHQTNAGYIPKKSDSERVATAKSSSYVGTLTEKDLNAKGLKELNRKYREDVAKNVEWSEAERKKHKQKLLERLGKQIEYMRAYPENVVSSAQRKPNRPPPPIPESFLKEVATSTAPLKPPIQIRPAPERQQSALFNAYATAQRPTPPPPSPAEQVNIDLLERSRRLEAQRQERRNQAFLQGVSELPQGAGISKFVSNAGGTRTKSGAYAGNYLLEAGLANASAGQVQDHFIQSGIKRARKHQMVVGMGLPKHHRPHTEGVGAGGNILRRGNPALQSQPFSANFSQASQLPPSYQRFHTSV